MNLVSSCTFGLQLAFTLIPAKEIDTETFQRQTKIGAKAKKKKLQSDFVPNGRKLRNRVLAE